MAAIADDSHRGGPYAGRIPWNSPAGRSISQDGYLPPKSPSPPPSSPRTPPAIELPAAPLFKDATASWSPPDSPSLRSRSSSILSSPRDSAPSLPVTPAIELTPREKRTLADRLYAAACAGDLDHILLLLSLGANVNSSSLVPGLYETFKPAKPGSLSPLAGAAGHGQFDAVELLLSRGATLNPHINSSSSSPLHEAIRADDVEIAQYLLDLGADVDSLNCWRTTPLMYAVKYGSLPVVELILAHDPDLHKQSFVGAVAIHWALFPNRPEVMEVLLRAGAGVERPLADGSTLLHCAVQAELVETVELLVRFGASVKAKNEARLTPVQVAEEIGNPRICHVLAEAAARRQPPA